MLETVTCKLLAQVEDCPENQDCSEKEPDCPTFSPEDTKSFIQKIEDGYEAQMIIDNLPVANIQKATNLTEGESPDSHVKEESHVYLKPDGFPIGCSSNDKRQYYVNNHLTFHIKYHIDKSDSQKFYIVGVGVIPSSLRHTRVSCVEGKELPSKLKKMILNPNIEKLNIPWSYSVEWEQSDIKFASRWDSYLHVNDPNEIKVHWLSIINSFVVVLFLTGLIAMILLRILKKDISYYNDEEEDNNVGWKLLHGDIFRPPSYSTFFAITVGSGVQVYGMFVITLIFSTVGFLRPSSRGSIMTLMLVFYALVGFIGGFVSLKLYRMFGGEYWKTITLLTAVYFPGIIFIIFSSFQLLLSLFTTSSIPVPFLALLQIVSIWIFLSLPLVCVGGYFGFNSEPLQNPTKVSIIQRQLPETPWYLKPYILPFFASVLPFGAVFIELYFIMSSIWLQKFYVLFGFVFVVFIILVLTSSEVAIIITYFQISSYDYQWWWTSLFVSGNSAFYMFGYSVFYYITKLKAISKIGMGIAFYGYMAIFSFTFFMLTSVVGFIASFLFLRYIYSSIKVE